MKKRLPNLRAVRDVLESHYAEFHVTKANRERFEKIKQSARVVHVAAIKNGGYRIRSKAFRLLGCPWPDFKRHIESQFKKGMTWENYGKWHIDHRIPISSASCEKDIRFLVHYMNLQPLWASDNLKKHASMPKSVQLHLVLR